MSTRRKFLVECSAVAVTASLAPANVLGAGSLRLREVPLEQIRFSVFAARLNSAFQVLTDSGGSVTLQLIEAQPTPVSLRTPRPAEDAANERFSLLFRGPLRQPLEQDTLWFQHPTIGRFAMFIVPISSLDTSHAYYEAIFNRPIGPLPRAGQGSIPAWRARNLQRRFAPDRSR